MNQRNPIVKATFIVFASIWIAMNLYTLITDPVFFWENIPNMVHGAFVTLVGCVMGVVITAGLILLERSLAQMRLQGGSFNGITSSIGPVPILAPPAKRAKAKECLPIESERVKQWIEANKTTNPAYVTLFMAVWQTLSAHKTHPASHRKGGHGGRTLAQHCMAVADTALELAPTWSYDGVYIKRPGKSPKLIIAKRDANYVFDPLDPIIPVLALAHDLGKIEAYKLQPDGTVLTRESGTEQDDAGVEHDRLGSRILARISEFWELPPNDTRTLSRVISHYHHPSDFPVDKDGLSIDDRMTALMEFLILADKTTGQRESGISAAAANEDTISETEAEEIYDAFLSCVTEKGRINGTGDSETDRSFKIGQKHGNLIYLREAQLLAAMCRKLGVSIEAGRGRFILLNRILSILTEKGLLFTLHNGVDFKAYQPLFFVRFYHSEESNVIASWRETIIISPTVKNSELVALVSLPALATVAKVERPYFAHLAEIAEPSKLMDMVEQAFGQSVIEAVREGLNISDAVAPMVLNAVSPSNAPSPANAVVAHPAVTPTAGWLPGVASAETTSPLTLPAAAQVQPPAVEAKGAAAGSVTSVAQATDASDSLAGIDWKCLDDEVKRNGFQTTAPITEALPIPAADPTVNARDILPAIPSIGLCEGGLSLISPDQHGDLIADDLDLVIADTLTDTTHGYAEPADLSDPMAPEAISDVSVGGDSAIMEANTTEGPLGIPENHDRGTVIQDVPKDPTSKYKKQKQEEKNMGNLAQLQQMAEPPQLLQQFMSAKGSKRANGKLAASLGTGHNPPTRYSPDSEKLDLTAPQPQMPHREHPRKNSYEVFLVLVQHAVENGSLHSLAEMDGKYFILQSMIEKVFPGKDMAEQLPEPFVERRTTSAGIVLLIPVAKSS
ncbi:HD domain-containing protein [Noviherbaspirillum soli]|uniref:hypothetical protein n=1 Tax=Noviherbaspirillum soli TaxID=1064518 RepID=UPI00188D6254|nr:hypothetical protein [Noviherbaspirillum soli]